MEFIRFSKRTRDTSWNMNKLESHSYYEIYFLRSGERTMFTENAVYNINKDTAVIIPPFTLHKTEGGAYERINMYISDKLVSNQISKFLKENETPHFFLLNQEYLSTINGLLEFACQLENNPTSKGSVEEKLSIFNTIIAFLKKCKKDSFENFTIKTTKSDKQIMEVVSYIHDNLTDKITIKDLCRAFYFTENNLSKKFKSVMDCTIGDYISMAKIEKAKELLYNTNKGIQQIADECGFNSLNYFSLIFKRKCGTSPSSFRRTR